MADAKWFGVLSTTEPRNDVGIIKVRQGNVNSEIVEFQIVQNNKPYDLTGLTVYFCASFGLNLVEKPAVVVNTTGGRIQYTFDDDSMQAVGRQKGYFSIKQAESKIDSTQDFEFQVDSSLMSRSIDGKSYIYRLSTLIKVLDDFIKNGQSNFNTWFESVKEILYGVDPGGNVLRELIEARKNSSGNIFTNLKARLDKNEVDTATHLAQIAMNVNDFGAIGDGIADDTIAIQNAINTKLNIIFGFGKTYKITDNLNFKDNTEVNLNHSKIVVDRTFNTVQFPLNLKYKENVRLYGGTLDANVSNQHVDNCQAIFGMYAKNCLVEKMTVLNYGISDSKISNTLSPDGTGIVFSLDSLSVDSDCYNNTVRDCILDSKNSSFAIRFVSPWLIPTSFECYNNKAYNNTVISCGKSGIEIGGASTHNCYARHNLIKYSRLEGIDIDKGAFNCEVSYNTIKKIDPPLSDISYVYGGIGCHSNISNDGFPNNVGHGNKILYNTIENSYGSGIYDNGCIGTIIKGNTIRNVVTSIIINSFETWVEENGYDVSISENIISNCEIAFQIDSVIDCNIINNFVTNCSFRVFNIGEEVYGLKIELNNLKHSPKGTNPFTVYCNGTKGNFTFDNNTITIVTKNDTIDTNLIWIRMTDGNVSVQNNLFNGGALVKNVFNLFNSTVKNVNVSNNTTRNLGGSLSDSRFTFQSVSRASNIICKNNIGTVLDGGIVVTGVKSIVDNIPY